MALYSYTVANKQNKRLSGLIEAPDEASARSELNSLGFSILDLKPADITSPQPPQEKVPEDHKHYIFEGINPQGQKITGTILSTDEFAAFKRLTEEYGLSVTATWLETATDNQISEAKAKGTFHLAEMLNTEKEEKKMESQDLITQDQQKKEILVRTRVENTLKQVNDLLMEYDKDIPPDKKQEINQKIDKLLRIKNSTNLDYIISSAEDLLEFIRSQETEFKQKNYLEKRTKLKIQIKSMLSKLHETGKPKSLSEDIINKIQYWQQRNVQKTVKIPWYTKLINNLLTAIKKFFETPEEIRVIKNQIRSYNLQLIEYIKVYFKEPTKEYKAKALDAIKTIWAMRKKAKENLKETKKKLKEIEKARKLQKEHQEAKEEITLTLMEEFTEFTGWLLAFYLIYYFVSLYLTSKNFGIINPNNIPKGLNFYSTEIFKYVLVTIFLLHTAFTIKTNFFQKTKIANLIIFPVTGFFVIFIIVNF